MSRPQPPRLDVSGCGLDQGCALLMATLAQSKREYAAVRAKARAWLGANDPELAAIEAEIARRLADIDLCLAWVQAHLLDGRPAFGGRYEADT